MSSIIDYETMNVDDLPGIWSPVQWELTEDERINEIENQAAASLLSVVDAPEAILRLLLSETAIERAYDPPNGYRPEEQGVWDANLVTFQFSRPIHMVNIQRGPDSLYIEYDFGDLGHWAMVVEAEKVSIEHI
jgi:hypothetical protein